MVLDNIHRVPERIAELERKLAAREGSKGYEENCKAIRAEIARLEAITAQPAQG